MARGAVALDEAEAWAHTPAHSAKNAEAVRASMLGNYVSCVQELEGEHEHMKAMQSGSERKEVATAAGHDGKVRRQRRQGS